MRWWTKIDRYQVKMNSRSHFFHRFTSARLPWFSFSMFYRAKQHHQPERSGKKRGAICWKYLLWQSFVTSPVVGKTRRNFSPAGQQPARHLHLADESPMFFYLVIGKEFAQIFVTFFFTRGSTASQTSLFGRQKNRLWLWQDVTQEKIIAFVKFSTKSVSKKPRSPTTQKVRPRYLSYENLSYENCNCNCIA